MGGITYRDQLITVVGYRPTPDRPMKMVVRSGAHEINIDKLGGEAPSPIEYLLASLAGCVNIVGEIIAREMGIKVDDMRIEVTGVFNAAKLMTGAGERAGYKEIDVKVYVKSEANPETLREWLRRIEERCPVSDNLTTPTPTKVSVERL